MSSVSTDFSDACAQMELRMGIIEMGFAGVDLNEIVGEQVEERQDGLIEEVEAIAEILTSRQEAAERAMDGFLLELRSIEFIAPEQSHVHFLRATVQKLRQIADQLSTTLASTEQELEKKKAEKKVLESSLSSLRVTLARARGQHYAFQQPLLQFGSRVCSTTAGIPYSEGPAPVQGQRQESKACPYISGNSLSATGTN